MKKVLMLVAIALPLIMFAEEHTIGYLGVSGSGLSEEMKIALDLEYGVLIKKVSEDSPADKSDIKIGDVILELDGEKVTDFSTLKDLVRVKPNKKVKLKLYRSQKTIMKKVKLDERTTTVFDFRMELPDIEDMKEMFGKSTEKLKEELDQLKKELEELKKELEELKKKIK